LEGDYYFEDGEEELGGTGDVDDVVYQLGDMGIALDCQPDDTAGAGGDLLDLREGLLVLKDGGGGGGVLGGRADYGERLVDEGVGAVLHLAGRVAFSGKTLMGSSNVSRRRVTQSDPDPHSDTHSAARKRVNPPNPFEAPQPNITKPNIPQEIWPNQSPHPLNLKVKTNPEGPPNLLRGSLREVTRSALTNP